MQEPPEEAWTASPMPHGGDAAIAVDQTTDLAEMPADRRGQMLAFRKRPESGPENPEPWRDLVQWRSGLVQTAEGRSVDRRLKGTEVGSPVPIQSRTTENDRRMQLRTRTPSPPPPTNLYTPPPPQRPLLPPPHLLLHPPPQRESLRGLIRR